MSTGLHQGNTAERSDLELEAIAQRLLAAVSTVRVSSLSLHDEHADVLWLTESVLGPDEHEAVRASLEIFAGEGAPTRHEYDLGDGRVAVTLRALRSGGSVLGVVMIIVDHRAARSPVLADAGSPRSALQGPLDDYAKWLSDDVSATQLRLRALPELALVDPQTAQLPKLGLELELEVDAGAAATDINPAAEITTPNPIVPISPALDRHFAALRAQPIVLYAQQLEPMAEVSRIRRYEILLRTGSEHGKSKAPTAMLEAAVKNGLGSVIDRRVITDLVVWLARNPEVWRTDPIAVSVNLSPTALTDPHFCKFLELCIDKADLPRGMIGFELDATLCAQNPERAAEFAQVLAALGCTVLLDDFALREGHVELLMLKGLRMLKLHPQITTNIGDDKRRQAVVGGIAQMACVLGMHTCAKAIESKQDSRWLVALKVDFGQGYGFSMPVPLASLAAV